MHEDWKPVREWHRIVNERDIEAARRVVTDDMTVGGPRGKAMGRDSFIDWIGHAGIRLEPVSWHPVDADTIVVEQDATWPDREDSNPEDPPVRLATLFRLAGDRVAVALRFDTLHDALDAASRSSVDES